MATKPDKEKKSPGKTGSASAKDSVKKTSSKPAKQTEEDDDDELDDETETPVSKKSGKAASSKTKKGDDDDDDGEEDGPDEWEKPEEEEEWDPDFEEFDVPKSKVKKADSGGKKPVEDDFTFEDDEFKDLLNDKDYDDDEEDDY
jgi:hypothetical protein